MSDEWVKAKNLINQQTQIMVNELSSFEIRCNNQARSIDILQRERDDALRKLEATPSMIMASSNQDLRRQVRELTEKNEQYREYMRLKDNAKIKVEQKRDYLRALLQEKGAMIGSLKEENAQWMARVVELESQNARQARDAVELREKITKKDEMIRQQSAENGRLVEVIKLGRKGIEGEGRDWELGYPGRDFYSR